MKALVLVLASSALLVSACNRSDRSDATGNQDVSTISAVAGNRGAS